jgi:hypothetical protein
MIENVSPFGAAASFAYDIDDTQMVVLCAAGRFTMPPAGTTDEEPLQRCDEQRPPPMVDQHFADPASSSLRCAGQGAVRRDGAEIYVHGTAWAPRGRNATEVRTGVRVGNCIKEVRVVGDRYWYKGTIGVVASTPKPFVSLPLVYERSFGGTAFADDGGIIAQEAANPIGRGVYGRRQDAIDRPLPNLEKPEEFLSEWDGRMTPWGYGPIPGSWQPRLARAGTYDQRWVEERLPLWPGDIDPRYFCAAGHGLTIAGGLRGGEPVVLHGFSPDGMFRFRLPEYRVVAKVHYGDRMARRLMRADGVLIDTDERVVTVFWRQVMPLGRGPSGFQRAIVRVLEPWEGLPQ